MSNYRMLTSGGSVATMALAILFATTASAQTTTTPPASDADAATATADQNQLQDIVVTAQKQSQNLQAVPIAVTAINGDALKVRAIANVSDLAGTIPGLTIEKHTAVLLPFLRGVGNAATAAGNESSVAIYVDGVYYSRLNASFFDLTNVDRVEVLKGPQGTLFGRNSTGGVINIVTRDPSFDTTVRGSFSYGRFNAFQGDFYGSTKLSDTVAIDLSVSAKTDDGFGRNIITGDRYGYEDSVLVRSKLLFQPSADTKIVLSGFYSASKQPGERGGFPGTASTSFSQPPLTYTNADVGFYNTNADANPRNVFRIGGATLRVEQNLSFAKLVSITAYSELRDTTVIDGDSNPRPDFKAVLHSPVNLFTQEVQLVNKPGSAFDWIIGGYYYYNYTAYRDTQFISPILFGPAGAQAPDYQRARSIAAFAQATYEVLPDLKLTGGIRYTKDRTSADGSFFLNTTPVTYISDLPASVTKLNRVTFKASADYKVTRDVLAYASFSRGYKSGNYNLITYNSTSATKPEGIDAYEVGVKSELFDRRVRFNGALFYYKISNPQVQQLQPGQVLYSNAGASEVKGAEFDTEAVLARGLTARASFTYLDSHYTDYPNAPTSIPDLVNGGATPTAPINAKGRSTPYAAKTTFDIGADYSTATPLGRLTLTADLYHNSGYFFEPDNFLHQGAYYLLNASAKVQLNDNVAVRVFGRNLTGSRYAVAGTTQLGVGGYIWAPAPPATYGVGIDFKL